MFSVLSSASLGCGGFMSDSCRELQRIDTLTDFLDPTSALAQRPSQLHWKVITIVMSVSKIMPVFFYTLLQQICMKSSTEIS